MVTMNEQPTFTLHGDRIDLVLDIRTYRLRAIKKAAYRLANRFTAELGSPSGDLLPVSLILPTGVGPAAADEAARSFLRELLDQELREEVAEETRPIRALILAQAFSRTDLIGHDESQ